VWRLSAVKDDAGTEEVMVRVLEERFTEKVLSVCNVPDGIHTSPLQRRKAP